MKVADCKFRNSNIKFFSMKKQLLSFIILLLPFFTNAQEYVSPYIKVGSVASDVNTTKQNIKTLLKANHFNVLGTYHPAGKSSLAVIVFTRKDLKNSVLNHKDRGALAAAQKIGLKRVKGQTIISYTNPDYFLRAYLGDDYQKNKSVYQKFHKDLKTALSGFGQEFKPFGGKEKAAKLKKYHYKIMMPYFSDPINLKKYNSYEEGYQTILNNLKNHKSGTALVYKIVYPSKHIAVFGVALKGTGSGSESTFLPKIGTDNVAAMPYEIILQGNQASMLHGKYRLAVSWPELSMGTFMRIVSTPGSIEDKLQAVCE